MPKSFTTACGLLMLSSILGSNSLVGAERPTMHVTCDPRPDILVHPIWDAHTEYRRQYNRPRFLTGWISSHIAPSSQEAMVWCENLHRGKYDARNLPPLCKRYYAPKPWEVLQTGGRPDTVKAESVVEPARLGQANATKLTPKKR